MDWILQNLESVVVPIIILILYGLGSAAQKKDKAAKKTPKSRRQQAGPDEVRRVEQIQEEIRRKIAERTGRVPPPQPKIAPVPVSQAEIRKPVPAERPPSPQPKQKFSESDRRPSPQPTPEVAASRTLDTESYQREIEAKLRKVRELEAQVKSNPGQALWGKDKLKPVLRGELRKQLFQDLSHPLGQKKAILISEILGSPMGIKGPSKWKANV